MPDIMTPEQVAQKFLQLQSFFGDQIAALDASGAEPASAAELWIDHFASTQLVNDPVIWDHLTRHSDTSTALFSQQLEALLAKSYDKRYPALKGRTLFPMAPGIPSGAETVAAYGYDYNGEATLLSSYGERVRRVDLDAKKTTHNIIGIASSWMMTVQQARAATMANVDINAKGLLASQRVIERKIDSLLLLGDSTCDIDGFFTLTTGASGVFLENKTGDLNGDWDSNTLANILADLDECMANFEADDIWTPTDLVLDPTTYARWRRLRMGTESFDTLMDFVSEKYELSVHSVKKSATADSAGTGPRAVFYVRDDEVVEGIISQEPEQLPSVWTGLGWETVMHARCGGVKVSNPGGILYADHKV